MRRANTGGLTFPRLMEEGYCFVDKSLLIKDILDRDPGGVYLFTRPRRFGKSTNLSMLDAFFNLKYEGNTWFDGLEISDHPEYDQYRNRYPVVMLDLKNIGHVRDMDSFMRGMTRVVRRAFTDFRYLMTSDALYDDEKAYYDSIVNFNSRDMALDTSLNELCSMLEEHHGRRAVVLMDEYDKVVTDTIGREVQGDIVDFMGGLMSSTLEGNPSLQMGYVTGVMPMAETGMLSGLDSLIVSDVFSTKSDERFGFTEDEVRWILSRFDAPDRFEEVRGWYDGYRFGDSEVYNPFSVMSYVSNGFVPGSYWIDSGSVDPLKWMLERVGMDSLGEVAGLISGSSVPSPVHTDLTYDDMGGLRREDLYSLMVLTGYLKAVPSGDGGFLLSIPNKEVMASVDRLLDGMRNRSDDRLSGFARAVAEGDAERLADALRDVLCDTSFFTLRDEASYELILTVFLHCTMSDYRVATEKESGNGRCDIVLTPIEDGVPPIIIELKVSRSESDLERDAEAAISRIHDRGYYLGMHGDVVIAGISFWGKVPFAKTEVVHLDRRFGVGITDLAVTLPMETTHPSRRTRDGPMDKGEPRPGGGSP